MIPFLARKPSVIFLSGLLLLAAGALVYSLERPVDTVLFLPAVLSLHDGLAHLPPALGGPLPTFLHTIAFALMTAAFLKPGPRGWLAAGIGWGVVNVVFELAQHPGFAARTGFAMPGYFDPLDIAAALVGAAAAFLVLKVLSAHRGRLA